MDNHNSNIQDDLEVEITPLNAPASAPLPRYARFPIHFWRHARQRTLALFAAIMVCLILLLIVVLPGSFPALYRTIKSTLIANTNSTPARTFTPTTESNSFYLDVNIPWTQVFLDGHLIHVPRIGIDPPLQLKSGHHFLEWHAEPFEVQSCIINIPFSSTNNCTLLTSNVTGNPLENQPSHPISLDESFFTLSNEREQSLITAVQKAFAAISATVSVQPGELYNRGTPEYTAASQPLQATLHYNFRRNPLIDSPYDRAGVTCTQLCVVPAQLHRPQTPHRTQFEWFALAYVSLSWNYTTKDGHIIASDLPAASLSATTAYPTLVDISWNDSSGWHITPLTGPELGLTITGSLTGSATPVQIVTDVACTASQHLTDDVGFYSHIRLVSGPNPADGCLAIASVNTHNIAIPTPASSHLASAIYFARFGVLWAINDLAHQLHPDIPLATPYVQHLAAQLAVFPGQNLNLP